MLKLFTILKPKSLHSRFLIIFLLPLIIIQSIAIYIFFERHWSSLTRNMLGSLTGEIRLSMEQVRNNGNLANIERFLNLKINRVETLPQSSQENGLEYFEDALKSTLPDVKNIKTIRKNDYIFTYIEDKQGIYSIRVPAKRLENSSTVVFVLWIVGGTVFFGFISYLFLKRQIHSILNFTQITENLGKNKDVIEYSKPQGASEIRSATIASIEMHERIKTLLEARNNLTKDLLAEINSIKAELEGESIDKKSLLEKIETIEKKLS